MKAYKLSIMEIEYDNDYCPQKYKEIKEKMFVVDNQTKDFIFKRFVEILPFLCQKITDNDIEWVCVENENDKKICI